MPLSKTDAPYAHPRGARLRPSIGTRFQRWRAAHSTNPDTRVDIAKAALRDPTTNHEGRVAARSELKAQGRTHQANVPLLTRLERIFRVRPAQKKARV